MSLDSPDGAHAVPPSPGRARVAARADVDPVAVDHVLRRLAARGVTPWLHDEVARRMATRLSFIKVQPARVLRWSALLGGGAEALREAYPKTRPMVAEPHPALQSARGQAPQAWWRAWRSLSGAAEASLKPADLAAGSVDLLWANMVLHGSDDPPDLFAQWQRLLAVDGFVMFSCFGPDTLKELRAVYAAQGWPSPGAAFVDMHDLGDMMVHAGFADPVMDQETLHLHWSDARSMLDELRGLGGNVSPARFAGLRTPRWARRLEALLQSVARDGRPGMSFEIVYGHAFKAAPRASVSSQTSISMEQMRQMVRSSRPNTDQSN